MSVATPEMTRFTMIRHGEELEFDLEETVPCKGCESKATMRLVMSHADEAPDCGTRVQWLLCDQHTAEVIEMVETMTSGRGGICARCWEHVYSPSDYIKKIDIL